MGNTISAKLFFGIELLYYGLGAYAAAWISDDFNFEKLVLFAYIGFPLLTIYYSFRLFMPETLENYPRSRNWLKGTCLAIFALGHICLLNAVTGESSLKRSVMINKEFSTEKLVVTIGSKRGGLGILYRKRW